MDAGPHPVSGKGVRKDLRILLKRSRAFKYDLKELGLMEFCGEEAKKTLISLMNNMKFAASMIRVYKYRWQIELFIAWIKQDQMIKSFLVLTLKPDRLAGIQNESIP